MNYTVKTTINNSPAAPVTATGNGVVMPLPNGEGVVEVLINATAVTGTTPSLTPSLQVSPDGVNWFTAVAGSAMTGVGLQRLACQSLCGYARLAYNVSGTTPSFTLTVTVNAN